MTDPGARRRALAERLVAEEWLRTPVWRTAVEAVPREAFLGPAIYRPSQPPGPTTWTPVRRDHVNPAQWSSWANQNTTWVTQIDGVLAEDATVPVQGAPTSSSTLPGLVVQMIEQAGAGPGDRVLEIGTGTGYSTALLCAVLGAQDVTSVEVDPRVAERARKALAGLDRHPHLIVGDGLLGAPGRAPYDRLVAACSVRHIPYRWLRQVRPGGTILVTLSGWMSGYGLVLLTVDDKGGATGRFLPGYTSFMIARPHDHPPHGTIELLPGSERETRVSPALLDDWTGRFVGQLAAPSAHRLGAGDEQVLIDVSTGSQARTRRSPDGEGWTVIERGPLALWDLVEAAIASWQAAGAPHQSGFGITVTPDCQRVWLGDPEGPGWRLPV
ncbi:ATP-grasp peptide maturase system methyltransferase [Streptomyces sp. NPDC017529]|uniref:ATP-grasp peptide maturase system methyltransferase n=1 Tax=Streptomyces sp. NPDC017529 TaxID=3365000 RepID=UPI0037AB5FA7